MGIDTSDVLGTSLYRTFSRNGLIVIAGVFLASLVGTIGFSSAVYDSFVELFDELAAENPEFAEFFDDPDLFLPLAFDLPPVVTLFLLAGSIIATVFIVAVAIRVFHAGLEDELPAELVFDNIAWVGVNLFVGGILFTILWGIGLVLFIIPGIILYVLFVYYMAAVAVEDRNFIDAFSRSLAVTKGERVGIFVLFLAVWLIAIAVSIAFALVGSFFILFSPVVAELIDLLSQSVVIVYFTAVVATSYRDLTTADEPDDDATDPFEEFTPASQTGQW